TSIIEAGYEVYNAGPSTSTGRPPASVRGARTARPPSRSSTGPGTHGGWIRWRPDRPPRRGSRRQSGSSRAGARSPSSAPPAGRRAAPACDSESAPPPPADGSVDRPGTSPGPAGGGTRRGPPRSRSGSCRSRRPSCNPCPCSGRGSSSWRSKILALADLLHDPPDALVAIDRVQQVLGGDRRHARPFGGGPHLHLERAPHDHREIGAAHAAHDRQDLVVIDLLEERAPRRLLRPQTDQL